MIRVGSRAINPSPIRIESQNVSRHRFNTNIMIRLAGSTVFHVIVSFLCKKNPNTNPVRIAVTVKPGKKTPEGKISIPSISPTAYPTAAQIGPYMIPTIATGRKPKPIRSIGVLMEQNRVSIISSAMRNAIVTNRVVLALLSIKKTPLTIVVDHYTIEEEVKTALTQV